MSNQNKLKAWVRYDGTGRVVTGGPIFQANKPKVGNWRQMNANLCCNGSTPSTTTTTTAVVPPQNNWLFNQGNVSVFPTSASGYTLYEGGFTSFDDGEALNVVLFAGTFSMYGTDELSYRLSTNGRITLPTTNAQLFGNSQDLYLTPGQPLFDGDTQNFWYQNTVVGNRWKTSILVYCGHCCGSPAEQTPYSYVLNVYRDGQFQYVEAVCKTNIGGISGVNAINNSSSTFTQVWKGDLSGNDWTYLGFGSIS